MMLRGGLVCLTAVVGVGMVLGCGGAGRASPEARTPPPPRGDHVIAIGANGRFSPEHLEIQSGETVTWKLHDRTDSIVRVTGRGGGCAHGEAWSGADAMAGPMPVAPSGIFTLGPYGEKDGLQVVRGACPAGTRQLVAAPDRSGDVLCDGAPRGGTMLETWQNPSLTGVHLRLNWSDIQPGPKKYDFDALGRELDRAVENGKLFSLSVKAGSEGTPDWIFSHGVSRVALQDSSSKSEGCGPRMDLGSPADEDYARLWNDMLTELGAFVRSRSDWYRALAFTRLGGANMDSAEARLPSRCRSECNVCNSEVWARSGYRPSKLYDFYAQQETTLSRAFPGKPMTYMLIQEGFPRVSDDGCWVADGPKRDGGATRCLDGSTGSKKELPKGTEQTEEIVRRGIATWGPLFHVQHNGLGTAAPPGTCPTYQEHPIRGPIKKGSGDKNAGEKEGSCPNRWVLEFGGSKPGQLTGFQTNTGKGVGSPADVDSAFQNMWDNSDAAYIEIYEQRAWEVQRAEAAGIKQASGFTLAEWAEKFHDRRRAMATAATPDPFPKAWSHPFTEPAGTVITYANGGKCTAGSSAVGTITIR
jgi:hypothetical protein